MIIAPSQPYCLFFVLSYHWHTQQMYPITMVLDLKWVALISLIVQNNGLAIAMRFTLLDGSWRSTEAVHYGNVPLHIKFQNFYIISIPKCQWPKA